MPDPNTSNLPELDIEAEGLAERALNLPTVGKLSKQHRKHLEVLLGKERADKIKKLDVYVVQEIYQEIAKRRAGLLGVIRVERPGEEELDLVSGPDELRNLIRDPNSKEAQALLWFYREHVDAGNRAEFSRIFEPMLPIDIRNVNTLKQMRELHSKLIADDDFIGLGHEGTSIDPTTHLPVGGDGRIGRKESEIARLEQSIEAKIAAKQDTTRLDTRAEGLDKELRDLNKKKRELEKHINQLNTLGSRLSPPAPPIPNIAVTAEDFEADTVTNHWSYDDYTIHGTLDSLSDWLSDDERGKDMVRFEEIARFGASTPTAKEALSRLLRTHFHDRVMFSEGQEERFYSEIERMLINMSGGAMEGGEGSSQEKDKGDKKGAVGKIVGATRTGFNWLFERRHKNVFQVFGRK